MAARPGAAAKAGGLTGSQGAKPMTYSVAARLAALENAFVILVDHLAERGAVDADALRQQLSRRAAAFRQDHGAADDPLGTVHALDLLAAEISGSTDWLRCTHD
jgi:hypothetical protein